MTAHFRTIDDLNALVVASLERIPRDVGLVVGIPRSGMLVASLVALQLDLPLVDLRSFLEGRDAYGGRRDEQARRDADATRVLVVDDSVSTGFEIRRVTAALEEAGLRERAVLCAAYASNAGVDALDLHFETLDAPQVFEWNWLHHPHLERMCLDLDGVLCRDARPEEDDDGERYREFLRSAEPRSLPSRPIGWLVTSRLERYRPETEDWLARHGVEVGELVMMDVATREERTGREIPFKADAYRRSGAILFVESAARQAEGIHERTGRPVFCTDTRRILDDRGGAHPLHRVRSRWTALRRRAGRWLRGRSRM